MPNISTIDLCRQHLFTAETDIIAQFGEAAAERVKHVLDMYMRRLSNPDRASALQSAAVKLTIFLNVLPFRT